VDAGQVAGLLVLLGVVGVLTAIVGSGIEAGPVKFPSIPGSRQKPLAVASVLVVAGGISWWVVQRTTGNEQTVATTNAPPPTEKLTISLIPESNDVHVGDDLMVSAEVSDSNGQQLGPGQCELDWRDSATNWHPTTRCFVTATEHSVTKPGVHHIIVSARGLGGLLARGSGTVDVTVGS
jgi:hypothetical protein